MKNVLLLMVLLAAPSTVFGEDYERILLPIASRDLAGGYGSMWITKFTIVNNLDRPLVQNIDAGPFGECYFPPCDALPNIPSKTAFDPWLTRPERGWKPGALVYVPREIANRLQFSLRVQDVSRQALTWGTEIPVVRERALRTETIVLPNVPLDTRFRQTLRVYEVDKDSATCKRVRIRILHQTTAAVLGERELELTGADHGPCVAQAFPMYPYAGEIHGIGQLLSGSAPEIVSVEITPLSSFRYWAFISVTNNETQHVTTITPQ